jgi:hypothetical protein
MAISNAASVTINAITAKVIEARKVNICGPHRKQAEWPDDGQQSEGIG